MTKAIAISPDKTVREITVDGLKDMQAVVDGYIEAVDLKNGVTMYINEEALYRFGPEDVNWIAADVAGLGGRPEFMFGRPPLFGAALLVGTNHETGETVDLPDAGVRWVKRVAREAGGVWK